MRESHFSALESWSQANARTKMMCTFAILEIRLQMSECVDIIFVHVFMPHAYATGGGSFDILSSGAQTGVASIEYKTCLMKYLFTNPSWNTTFDTLAFGSLSLFFYHHVYVNFNHYFLRHTANVLFLLLVSRQDVLAQWQVSSIQTHEFKKIGTER